ncbi:MAG: zf-HC2 domain-containing protein [Phycisphaerales bacterium]|nr:zf-HC2 domain-containing protein [Phycisphaerales bacterium]
MTCRELFRFIDAYLDAELEMEVERAFEFHLDQCPACRAYLESYRQTIELVGDARPSPAPGASGVPTDLVRIIASARRISRR